MSSVDDSDDEFESADEDIDFESKLEADAEEEERRDKSRPTDPSGDRLLPPLGEKLVISDTNVTDVCEDQPKTLVEDSRQSERTNASSDSDVTYKEKSSDYVEDNKTKEVKTGIKARKLLRKADRIRDQTPEKDSELLEQKKLEVLSKLSDLSQSSSNASNWNNWFTDIKSAAKTATSTTVTHVSQASNKWSFDPKSLLSGAASLTTTVGSGLSSVVDNVASVVDSAIGAPPPEQMAALVNSEAHVSDLDYQCDQRLNEPQDKELPTQTENEHKREEPEQSNSSKGRFGFGLFDYTLNTLESIGKKTMEVIAEDNKKDDKR